MADVARQRKQKKRKEPRDETTTPKVKDEPTKEEYKIAKWMRKNVPTKKTKFLSHTVEYFTACKAVDQLLESPWAQAPKKEGEEALFTTRESIVDYLEIMLRHKMFHRARKIIVPESELKSKKKKDKEKEGAKEKDGAGSSTTAPPKESSKDEKEAAKKDNEATATAAESSQAEGEKVDDKEKKKQKKDEGEKKKRKIRLDMHLEQLFVDGLDAYVWIYEPTPYYYYFFGFLVVIAVIAVCLFPLWPSSVRQGVYYLSLGAAGFLVFILALAVIRLIAFCIVWGLTLGRHHLWLLPNLTEDVGFLASFWPLYKHEYNNRGEGNEIEGDEGGNSTKSDETTAVDSVSGSQKQVDTTKEGDGKGQGSGENSETESEGSQRSQTGKDFEIVDRDEINENES